MLGPNLYPVFTAMPGQYRVHALAVYRRVRDRGCHDTHVWQAALLHDAGKYDPATGRSVTTMHRALIVLLKLTPTGKRLLDRLGSSAFAKKRHGLPSYCLYPFYLSKHHASLGAERAARQGAAPEVVRLIADHHVYEGQSEGLLALQAADEQS